MKVTSGTNRGRTQRPLTSSDSSPMYPAEFVHVENPVRRVLGLPELTWIDGVPHVEVTK